MKTLVLFVVAIMAVGCSKSSDPKAPEESVVPRDPQNVSVKNFKYQFVHNGCSTGEKAFATEDEMCTALGDDSQNNACALELRKEYFGEACPGRKFVHQSMPPNPKNGFLCTGTTRHPGMKKEINQIVYWDRKTPVEHIILDFPADISEDNHGQISLRFSPADVALPEQMMLHGWFVDSTKNISVSGYIGSTLTLKHTDGLSQFQSNIEISCRPLESIPPLTIPAQTEGVLCINKISNAGETEVDVGGAYLKFAEQGNILPFIPPQEAKTKYPASARGGLSLRRNGAALSMKFELRWESAHTILKVEDSKVAKFTFLTAMFGGGKVDSSCLTQDLWKAVVTMPSGEAK